MWCSTRFSARAHRRRGKKLGRHFIGIENEAAYVQAAARISKIKPLDDESLEVVKAQNNKNAFRSGAGRKRHVEAGHPSFGRPQGAGARAR